MSTNLTGGSPIVITSSKLKSGNLSNIESNISAETITFDMKDEFDSTTFAKKKCVIYTANISKLNDISNDSFASPLNSTIERNVPSSSVLSLIENKLRLNEKFSFPKDTVIVFMDQANKSNDFLSLFSKTYEMNVNSKMLANDPFEFKIVNKKRIKKIIEECKTEGNPILAMYNKNTKLGIKKNRSSSTIIIQTQNLTKIPIKRNSRATARLNIEYNKAKNAAVHVRRMEYAYHMEIVTFKFKFECIDKAKIIQCWWRSMQINNMYNFLASRIQCNFRGRMARLAVGDALHIVDDVIPFAFSIENIIFKHKVSKAFQKIYNRFGIMNFSRRVNKYLDTIKEEFREYYINKCIKLNGTNTFVKPKKEKCVFKKWIFDHETRKKLDKLIANIKGFLLRKNEKYMRKIAFQVQPYLFYKLKYQNKAEYQQKIEKFHTLFHKFRVLNLRVNKSLNNEFEFFDKALKTEIIGNIAKKAHVLYENKKFLKSLVKKYDLKKYFKFWKFRMENTKKMTSIFFIPTKFTSLHKLQKMKGEMKKLNYTQFALDLEKIHNKYRKKETLDKLMKFSQPYVCRKMVQKNINRNIKEYFNSWKNKSKIIALLSYIQRLQLRKKYNVWTNLMYKSNPSLLKFKKMRKIINKKGAKELSRLKEAFNKWKRNIFEDLNYKLKKYQDLNFKLLRFHLWKNNAMKLKFRQKKYINAILNAHSANEQHFLKNALEYFFNKWKIHNEVYKKYIAPNEKTKMKMFILLLETTFTQRQLLIYKAYFYKTIFILTHMKTGTVNNNK